MWTIRQEQTVAFRQYHLQKFEHEMVVHLERFAPKHWKVIGEPTGREVIQLGIQQAQKYGFTNRGPVRFYIELMFMFGSYFDTDPQYPWAIAVLNDRSDRHQMTHADRLFDAAREYIAQVVGPKDKYLLEALHRLSKTRIERLLRPEAPLEETAFRALHSIYPQNCEYLGEMVVRESIRYSLGLARSSYGFTTAKGALLIVALTFFVGRDFSNDPLYGWIARRLDARRQPDPTARVEELYSKAMLYLRNTLAEGARG
jgi:hypothetical protein